MKTIEEFKQFYETDLRLVLEELEARRVQICRNFWRVLGVAGVLVAVALAVGSQTRSFVVFVVAGPVAAIIAVAVAWGILTRGYVPDFKTRVIGVIAQFIDPSLQYAPTGHVRESDFIESHVFLERPDRYSGEDYVRGKIGATAIEFSEVHAEYKTESRDSKGRTQTEWHTIFKGLFVIADFNKEFRTATVVVPDVAEKLLGRLGTALQKMNISRSGQLVHLEDPDFEKEFVVYGDDQVEARYILSPALMQRILDFKRRTGREVSLSFVHSNVHVAITTGRDMFEPRMFRSLLDFDLVREYFADLEFAVGIVDDLNLNTRIWTKE